MDKIALYGSARKVSLSQTTTSSQNRKSCSPGARVSRNCYVDTDLDHSHFRQHSHCFRSYGDPAGFSLIVQFISPTHASTPYLKIDLSTASLWSWVDIILSVDHNKHSSNFQFWVSPSKHPNFVLNASEDSLLLVQGHKSAEVTLKLSFLRKELIEREIQIFYNVNCTYPVSNKELFLNFRMSYGKVGSWNIIPVHLLSIEEERKLLLIFYPHHNTEIISVQGLIYSVKTRYLSWSRNNNMNLVWKNNKNQKYHESLKCLPNECQGLNKTVSAFNFCLKFSFDNSFYMLFRGELKAQKVCRSQPHNEYFSGFQMRIKIKSWQEASDLSICCWRKSSIFF